MTVFDLNVLQDYPSHHLNNKLSLYLYFVFPSRHLLHVLTHIRPLSPALSPSEGMVMNHTDDLFLHSKHHNKLDTEDEVGVTGIEGAIDVLDVSGKEDKHPEKRMKVSLEEL